MAVAISFACVLLIVGVAESLKRSGRISFDVSRKIIHVGVGTWILPTVLLFDRAIWAALLPGVFVILNLLSRRLRLVRAMEDEAGDNVGTILFPLAFVIAILSLWSQPGGKGAMTAGILVLAWGDAAAALLGRRFGRHRYRVGSGYRSLEGSAAMFLFSILAIWVAGTVVGPAYGLGLILGAAALATLLEGVSPWGIDNLLVPLGTAALLWRLG